MAPARSKAAAHATPADSSKAVGDFIRALEHPFKGEIQAIREAILAVSPTIAEGIKWNAPSFRTSEYFATRAAFVAVVLQWIEYVLHV